VGIAHMGDSKTVGRIGAKTMGWFITASLMSLILTSDDKNKHPWQLRSVRWWLSFCSKFEEPTTRKNH
jgi:hypothetical protein